MSKIILNRNKNLKTEGDVPSPGAIKKPLVLLAPFLVSFEKR